MMNKNLGFIQLNRGEISNSPWFRPENRKLLYPFLYLLIHATHIERLLDLKGSLIPIKRGQLARSMGTLAIDWGVSRTTVRRYLDKFKNYGDISYGPYKDHGKYITTITTINVYDAWTLSPVRTAGSRSNQSLEFISDTSFSDHECDVDLVYM